MGQTLTLELPNDVYESLVKAAKQANRLPEELATQWLADTAQHVVNDPLEPFIGAFSSNIPDWAEQHDKYLGEAIKETLRNTEPQGHSGSVPQFP